MTENWWTKRQKSSPSGYNKQLHCKAVRFDWLHECEMCIQWEGNLWILFCVATNNMSASHDVIGLCVRRYNFNSTDTVAVCTNVYDYKLLITLAAFLCLWWFCLAIFFDSLFLSRFVCYFLLRLIFVIPLLISSDDCNVTAAVTAVPVAETACTIHFQWIDRHPCV